MGKQMEKWQCGDLAAFEELFRQNEKQVYRTAYLMAGSKEEAEDILQEVFLSVWRFREKFDPARSRFSTWLNRITVNECLKNHRGKDKYALSNIEEMEIADSGSRQPEEVLISKAEYEKLLAALAKMDKKHRAVLVLRYFNGMPYSDIAKVLGIPLGTVKSRLNQGLSCLRAKIAAAESGA
jgi:RNA polymerase sigma-70 factor (ECF subfamily)